MYLDDGVEGLNGEDWDKNKDKVDQTIPFVRAKKILEDTPPDKWPTKANIIQEIFREKYRLTWTQTSARKILATVSNLMICDDHEFLDDLGAQESNSDPKSKDYFLAKCALRVYHEYQRQLWDPEILKKDPESLQHEGYSLIFGKLGLIMTESRTSKSLYKEKRAENDESYFGQEQQQSIEKYFKTSTDISMWLFISPLPLLFIKRKLVELATDIAGKLLVKII